MGTYNIRHFDTTVTAPIATLTTAGIDTAKVSIGLIGPDTDVYGEMVNSNFLHMMEHFSKATAPANLVKGQLWFDKTADHIKICTDPAGPTWKELKELP